MIQVRNPRWANAQQTAIVVEAVFPWLEELGFIPFSATATDTTEHTIAIFNGAIKGDFGVIKPYEPPPYTRQVPQEVTRFQALAALLQAGLLDDIEAYMETDSTDAFTKLAWKEVLVFKRTSPLVASIGTMFGLTDTQIDDLFVFAATIDA